MFAVSDATLRPTKVTLVDTPAAMPLAHDSIQHKLLLEHLVSRLEHGNSGRNDRVLRYARIDKLISTWQALDDDDSARMLREQKTGVLEAITFNLPLLATHLEDTVAFFAEVYSPTGRDYYSTAPNKTGPAAKALAEKLNQDTRIRRYYAELCMSLRSLIKYNMGGFHIRWEEGNKVAGTAEAGNRHEAIDLYNFLWDPGIDDIRMLPTEGEWSAQVHRKNRMWLIRNVLNGTFTNVKEYLEKLDSTNTQEPKEAKYYKYPPTQAGLTLDGQDSHRSNKSVNWAGYFEGINNTSKFELNTFEVVEMYCWVNPKQFKLVKASADEPEVSLWKFTILDAKYVIKAERITAPGDLQPLIPHVLGYLTLDDTREAQRSIMELMRGFQRFGSFLMNIYVNGARKNIWGLKAVDPSIMDTSGIDKGQVAGIVKAKTAGHGKDMRMAIADITPKTGVDESFQMLGNLLQLVQNFFPTQAQPAQIAGIDRAVKSQVAAVLQGANRRMHMGVKILDACLMMPARVLCYRNLVQYEALEGEQLNEDEVATVLGSGLMSIDAERWAESLKELIFALFQNPESMAQYDMAGLMSHWSRLQNSSTDLGDFYKPPAPPVGDPNAPPADPTAPAPIPGDM